MALPDLTGQNIQDTYQRILTVGDGGHMFDGTGSIFVPLSASVEVTKEISSSHADTASYIDTSNIAQPFNNITASSDISASGDIFADSFRIQDRRAITVNASDIITIAGDSTSPGVQFGKHDGIQRSYNFDGDITASGNISASGNIHAGTRIKVDEMIAIGAPTTDILRFGAGATILQVGAPTHSEPKLISLNGPVTASGDISASGTITGIINGGTF